jgi:Uma2 family endonuclease
VDVSAETSRRLSCDAALVRMSHDAHGTILDEPTLLVVEVLSPSTETFDRQVKAQRFAALGVPCYWILDPEARRLEC